MVINFDQQDIVDSIAVYISKIGDGCFTDLVDDIIINYDENHGFTASGRDAWNTKQHLDEQELINAVATYLSGYHSFDEDSLVIQLTYDKVFTAEIVVERE